MENDIIVEGLNLSALSRNFKVMANKINQQNNAIELLKKDLHIALNRIDKINSKSNFGSDSAVVDSLFKKFS